MPYQDPDLVAGFAAEARSHLPEIRQALAGGASDPQALGAARRHLSSMRDASSMVGLAPLGRALELFAAKLASGHQAMTAPLRLLDEYLEGLEEHRDGLLEPQLLLQELAAAGSGGPGSPSPPTPSSGSLSLQPPGAAAQNGSVAQESEAQHSGAAMAPRPALEASDVGPPVGSAGSAVEAHGLPLPPWLGASGSREIEPAQAPPVARRPRKHEGPSAAVREIFAAESDEHAQEISKLLGQLQVGSFTGQAIPSLRRRVHNLKGSASLVKLEELSRVAHGMEDLLDVFYEQRRGPSDGELRALELAGDALQALIYGRGDGVDVPEVLQALARAGHEGQETGAATSDPGPIAASATDVASADRHLEPAIAGSSHAASVPPPPAPAAAAAAVDSVDSVEAVEEASGGHARQADSSQEHGDRRRFVRVSVDALDEAMRLLVEVDAERHHLRQLVADQRDHALELDLADRRLHREVRALESDLEVAALGSRILRSSGAASDTPFDPLELDRYSELHERSRSLIESTGDLETVGADLGQQLVSIEHSIERLEGSTVRLRDRLLGLRLVPFSSLSPRLEGVVRLAARAAGKAARLHVDDGGVELDKDVLDALVDPLGHLLRNAVAHGIETPARRQQAGKQPEGTVRLVARYRLEGVELRIEDDGAGIDDAAVSSRAVERGLLQPSDIETWGDERIRELIFQPGLSTAKEVDQLAGRGVGMDVVRQRLAELRGRVWIESSSARGTVFRLELPTSLAVQRVLLVQDGGHRLALPSQGLERMERISPDRLERLGQRQVLRAGEEIFHVVPLARSAGLAGEHGGSGEPETGGDPVAIFSRLGGRPTAFLVDKVLGAREVVVQDLGRHLGRRPGLLGVTQTGTGHPVPILDPAEWLDGDAVKPTPRPRPARRPRRKTVLVVDDSLSMRRYLRQLVERFGYLGIEARDGRDAMELLDGGAVEPSLVLLDLEMPRMDGFELMATLRSDPRFESTPRVVLTSRDAEKHRHRAAVEGADGYLVKPVGEGELESTLERFLLGSGAS